MSKNEDILDTFVNRAEGATRGAVISDKGKTRVTMYLDDAVLNYFRDAATKQGCGYQTLINSSLRSLMGEGEVSARLDQPSTVELQLRDISGTLEQLIEQIRVNAAAAAKGTKRVMVRNMGVDPKPKASTGGYVELKVGKRTGRNTRLTKGA